MFLIVSDLQSQKCRNCITGYCKFLKTKCKFVHPKEQCVNESCDKVERKKRHPKFADINVQNKVIENLKNDVKVKEKENYSLVAKSNEAKASIEKMKEKFARDKSDLTKQKLKAIEESKVKPKEANDTITLKDNL